MDVMLNEEQTSENQETISANLQAESSPEDSTSVEDSFPARSSFHRQMRTEIDEVLKASLSRRVRRMQKKVPTTCPKVVQEGYMIESSKSIK